MRWWYFQYLCLYYDNTCRRHDICRCLHNIHQLRAPSSEHMSMALQPQTYADGTPPEDSKYDMLHQTIKRETWFPRLLMFERREQSEVKTSNEMTCMYTTAIRCHSYLHVHNSKRPRSRCTRHALRIYTTYTPNTTRYSSCHITHSILIKSPCTYPWMHQDGSHWSPFQTVRLEEDCRVVTWCGVSCRDVMCCVVSICVVVWLCDVPDHAGDNQYFMNTPSKNIHFR